MYRIDTTTSLERLIQELFGLYTYHNISDEEDPIVLEYLHARDDLDELSVCLLECACRHRLRLAGDDFERSLLSIPLVDAVIG